MGTIPYINVWDTILCSNFINRKGILRIQSGTEGDWDNSQKNIYCENSLNKIYRLYYCVCVNVSYSFKKVTNMRP